MYINTHGSAVLPGRQKMDIIEIVAKFTNATTVELADGGFATSLNGQPCNGWTFIIDGKPFDVWTYNKSVLLVLPV